LVVDSGGPKEAQVQSYSPGGANVPDDTAVTCAKMAQPIDFAVWVVGWWAEGRTSSIAFASWRQCALMGGHIAQAGNLATTNRPSAAAMRPYVKLL